MFKRHKPLSLAPLVFQYLWLVINPNFFHQKFRLKLCKFRPKKVLFPICSKLFNSFMFIHCHLPLIVQLPWIHPMSQMLHLYSLYILMCRFFALSHFPIFIHCLTPLVSSNVQFLRIFQLCRIHPLSKVPTGFIQCKISKDSSMFNSLIFILCTSIIPLLEFVNPFSNSLKFIYYPTSFQFIHYPSSLDSFIAKKSKDVIMYFTWTSIWEKWLLKYCFSSNSKHHYLYSKEHGNKTKMHTTLSP